MKKPIIIALTLSFSGYALAGPYAGIGAQASHISTDSHRIDPFGTDDIATGGYGSGISVFAGYRWAVNNLVISTELEHSQTSVFLRHYDALIEHKYSMMGSVAAGWIVDRGPILYGKIGYTVSAMDGTQYFMDMPSTINGIYLGVGLEHHLCKSATGNDILLRLEAGQTRHRKETVTIYPPFTPQTNDYRFRSERVSAGIVMEF